MNNVNTTDTKFLEKVKYRNKNRVKLKEYNRKLLNQLIMEETKV